MGKLGTFKVNGIPILVDKPSYGQAFFVGDATIVGQDTAVDAAGYGDKPTRPFATLDFALSKCVANRGDTIYVMPGHTETISAASGLNVDIAGTTIEGLGAGSLRPTLTLDTADTATIAMTAANATLRNFVVTANFADIAVGIITSAKYVTIEKCDFLETATNMNFFSCIETDAVANSSDGLKIIGNRRISIDAAALAFLSILEAQTDVAVLDNFDNQSSAADIGHFMIQGAFDVLALNCQRNILNLNGDNNTQAVGVFLTGSSTASTGIVAHNLVNNLDTTTELFDTATLDYGHFQNFMTGTIAKSGYVLPAIDS